MKVPFARLTAVTVLCGAASCAGLTPTGTELSTGFEPPRAWDAAVFFVFGDSSFIPGIDHATRIEFHDGVRQRVITSRDLFDAPTGERRTPWYRLRPGASGVTTQIRVILEHESGGRTTADYPLAINRDEFVTVLARVYTRDPNEWYISMPRHRKAFALHPAARAQPGDSLWISHVGRQRECFDCPN